MKTKLLWPAVILTATLIFIGWLFSLKYTLNASVNEDSFISNLKRTFFEVSKSFENLGEGLEKDRSPAATNSLTDEEFSRLKKKVLEYEEKIQKEENNAEGQGTKEEVSEEETTK